MCSRACLGLDWGRRRFRILPPLSVQTPLRAWCVTLMQDCAAVPAVHWAPLQLPGTHSPLAAASWAVGAWCPNTGWLLCRGGDAGALMFHTMKAMPIHMRRVLCYWRTWRGAGPT